MLYQLFSKLFYVVIIMTNVNFRLIIYLNNYFICRYLLSFVFIFIILLNYSDNIVPSQYLVSKISHFSA